MRALRALIGVSLMLAVGAACAQDAKDIVIAGQIVARVRDKGPYDSVSARAAKIDQWINDVISYGNTQQPKVRVAQKNGVWHVFVVDRPILDVYPGDAKPQNLDPKTLAQMWAANIKAALPKSTPVSRLPAVAPRPGGGAVTPAPGPRVPAVPTAPGPETLPAPVAVSPPPPSDPGSEPVTGTLPPPLGTSTTPTGETVPLPKEEPLPEPSGTPRSAAMLLLLDAFNSVRALAEDEYLGGRDRLASNLLENLEPFMRTVRETGVTAGTPEPPRPPIEVVPPKPPTETVKPPTPPSTPPKPPTPPETTGPRVPTVPTAPATGGVKPPTPVHATGDASTVRVPQKQRIKRKFEAAAQPFQALKNAGDPKADQVSQLLRESRDAHTAGDFDVSEAKVDEALRLMGVPIPQ